MSMCSEDSDVGTYQPRSREPSGRTGRTKWWGQMWKGEGEETDPDSISVPSSPSHQDNSLGPGPPETCQSQAALQPQQEDPSQNTKGILLFVGTRKTISAPTLNT